MNNYKKIKCFFGCSLMIFLTSCSVKNTNLLKVDYNDLVISVICLVILISIAIFSFKKIKVIEEKNSKLNKYIDRVFETANFGIWALCENMEKIYFDENLINILNVDLEDIKIDNENEKYIELGLVFSKYIEDESVKNKFDEIVKNLIKENETYSVVKKWKRNGDENSTIAISITISVEKNEVKNLIFGSIREMTESYNIEENLKKEATYDYLTESKNRNAFFKIDKKDIKGTTMCFFDVDNFKQINDAYGHDVGDKILKTIVKGFLNLDFCKDIYRIGGDEFIILIDSFSEEKSKILANVSSQPIIFDTYMLTASGSFVFLDTGLVPEFSLDTITKIADYAMNKSKELGKNNISIVDEKLLSKYRVKVEIDNLLYDAVKNKEFTPYYQPYVNITTGKIIGYEVLVRWQVKDKVFYPDQFIPVAVKSGLIYDIDMMMYENNIQFYKKLKYLELINDDFLATSNFSAESLVRANVYDLQMVGDKYNVKLNKVTIEVTEQLLLNEKAMENVENMKKQGIPLAIDDFSAGHSSLKQLQDVKFDVLKIDKALVDDISKSENSEKVFRAVAGIGESFGLKVVSEGIEFENQIPILNSCKILIGQGYFYYRPMPEDEFLKLLLDGK